MDGELVTAIVATGVSAVATGYAAIQAHIAKGAARSAEAQVVLLLRQIEGRRRTASRPADPSSVSKRLTPTNPT